MTPADTIEGIAQDASKLDPMPNLIDYCDPEAFSASVVARGRAARPRTRRDGGTAQYRIDRDAWMLRNEHIFGEAPRYTCSSCRDSHFVVIDDHGPGTVKRCSCQSASTPRPWRTDDPLTFDEARWMAVQSLHAKGAAWVLEEDEYAAGQLALQICRNAEHNGRIVAYVEANSAPEEGHWHEVSEIERKRPAVCVMVVQLGLSWAQARQLAGWIRAARESCTVVVGPPSGRLGAVVGPIVWGAIRARGGIEIGDGVVAQSQRR